MGILFAESISPAPNPSLAAETVIATLPVLQTGPGASAVAIDGTYNLTPGTGTTAVTIRCRQGSLTGTQLPLSAPSAVAAGAQISISYGFTDTTPYLEGGGQYVITAQQTGATANGTSQALSVTVTV